MESGQPFWVTLNLVHRSDSGCPVQLPGVNVWNCVEQREAEMLLVKLLRVNISQGKSPVVNEKWSPREEYVFLLVDVPFPF